jgi:hypothetical protein
MIQKKEAESRDKPKAIIKGEHPEGVRSNSGADLSVRIIEQLPPVIGYFDYKKSVTVGTAVYGTVRTVV